MVWWQTRHRGVPPCVALLAPLVAVLALASCSGTATPPAPTPSARVTVTSDPTRPAAPGFSPGYRILDIDDATLARHLDLQVSSGSRWLRVDLDWSTVEETEGTDDWTAPDRVISAARARGLEVIALPTYAPEWGTRPAAAPDAGAPLADRFAAFVARAAARYVPQGVTTWEIWNEPNVKSFWGAPPDTAAYTELLRQAAGAVRTVEPRATVLSGGLAPVRDSKGNTVSALVFVREVLAAGGLAVVDGVALHPYSYYIPPSRQGAGTPSGLALLPAAHALLSGAGLAGTRVWVTEYGAPTGTSARAVAPLRQAAIIREGFATVRRYGWAGPMLVYADRDAGRDPENAEDNFGLVDVDFRPKPALDAFRVEAARSG